MYSDDNETISQGTVTQPLSGFERRLENYLFTNDRAFLRMILNDVDLHSSFPRHTPLNRLTNITSDLAEILNLETESDYTILEMFMNEDEYDSGKWMKIASVIRTEKLAAHDPVNGWKLERLKIAQRRITVDDGEPKKGRGWLRRR